MMKKNILVLLGLIGFSALWSQQTALDTVQTISEVMIIADKARSMPGSAQLINNKTIDKLNQTNINSVLRTVPGVSIRDEEGFGLRPNIGLRGTSLNRSAKITLMEDGILIAPAAYSDPSAYYFPTFARMQSVEILKGSSQIKYGPYTIGGAVNLISTPIPSEFKAHVQLSYGSFGNNQQRIWLGDNKKNLDYLFELNRIASKGFKKLDNGGNTGFDRRDILAKIRWHTDEKSRLKQSLSLKYVNCTEDANETYLGLSYEDFSQNPLRRYAASQKDHLQLSHQFISLTHSIIPLKALSLNTVAYYGLTFRDWGRVNSINGISLLNIISDPTTYQNAYQVMSGQAMGLIDYQNAARSYFSKGIQVNTQYLFKTGKTDHSVFLGLRYHTDQADRYATKSIYSMDNKIMSLTSSGVQGNQENQIRNANSISAYLNYDIRYLGLKLSPGIRFEQIQFEFLNYGTADNARTGSALKSAQNKLNIVLPGLGFSYEFNEKMNVIAGIYKGFSPPGMPSTNTTQGQAKVEMAWNSELGYRIHSKNFNGQLLAFLSQYSNILGSDNMSAGGTGSGEMFNAGHATIQGLELSLEFDLMSIFKNEYALKLPLSIAYTFTDARFQENFVNGGGDWGTTTVYKKDIIPFVTPHTLSSSISLESNKWLCNLNFRMIAATRIKPSQSALIFPSPQVKFDDVNAIAAFSTMDLSINYKLQRRLKLFSTVQNLTNNQSIVSNLPQAYRPAMPISFNFGIKAELD